MRRALMAGIVLGCLAFSTANAQIDTSRSEALASEMEARLNAAPDPTLPAVDTLSCEQMHAEMMVAGQQMQSQLDPSMETNITSLQADMQRQQRGAMAGAMGAGLMCAVPGLGMACGAVMNAQMASQMRQGQQSQDRMDVIMGQMNDSTQGLDLARMQALNERWESQQCQMPEQTTQPPAQ